MEFVEGVVGLVPFWLGLVFLVFSYLGSSYVVFSVSLVRYFRGFGFGFWIPILLVGYGLFGSLKFLFFIDRPGVSGAVCFSDLPSFLVPVLEGAVGFSSGSFPSGHAVAVAIFTVLIVLDSGVLNRGLRLGLGVLYIVGVGFSRIVLGVHYLGDVIGGVVIGLVVGLSLYYIRENSRYAVELISLIGVLVTAPTLYFDFYQGLWLFFGFFAFYTIHSVRTLVNDSYKNTFIVNLLEG
ncbi:phosphatase PAP2 family protein [Methanonatronarchaeum thermophilum]|uniref:phosphatase PAP2 family protein n=1 Tax=Methanonatronarchaeum thermophilum TaxID=1927129 RepID=UPI001374774B|nr:phosphatase PAP2 family protein [Methanonatronarchaeum thermophilum]